MNENSMKEEENPKLKINLKNPFSMRNDAFKRYESSTPVESTSKHEKTESKLSIETPKQNGFIIPQAGHISIDFQNGKFLHKS